jgi:hypothetical protein
MAMRVLIGGLVAFCALVAVSPAPAVACNAPSVPIYPGAELPDGTGMSAGGGNLFVATTAPLIDIQAFYYTRMPNEGWAAATQLPGQYPDQHGFGQTAPRSGNLPQSALEFSRNDDHEFVRIVGAGGGYSIYVSCRD